MQLAQLAQRAHDAVPAIALGVRARPLSVLKQALADFRQGALSRTAAQETIQALAELSDEALADIGLHRSQILSIAMNPTARFR